MESFNWWKKELPKMFISGLIDDIGTGLLVDVLIVGICFSWVLKDYPELHNYLSNLFLYIIVLFVLLVIDIGWKIHKFHKRKQRIEKFFEDTEALIYHLFRHVDENYWNNNKRKSTFIV